MSAPWPAPAVPEPVGTGRRSVWAWLAFVLAMIGGVGVAWLSLASWFVWTIVWGVGGGDGTGVWLWTLVVIAFLANVLPIVGIVLVDQRSGPVPYLLMLAPTPTWFLTFTIILS